MLGVDKKAIFSIRKYLHMQSMISSWRETYGHPRKAILALRFADDTTFIGTMLFKLYSPCLSSLPKECFILNKN